MYGKFRKASKDVPTHVETNMIFCYCDFSASFHKKSFSVPMLFFPQYSVDSKMFMQLKSESSHNDHTLKKAFIEARERMSRNYYQKVFLSQSLILDQTSKIFPAYRFLLPEIIANEWLAEVDWRKFQRDHILHQSLSAYTVQKVLNNGNSSGGLKISGNFLLDKIIDSLLTWDKTAYLREYLIELGVEKNDPLISIDKEKASYVKQFWRWLIYETVFIATLFHDTGYSRFYLDSLNSRMSKVDLSCFGLTNSDLFAKFKSKLILYPLNGYRRLSPYAPIDWTQELSNTFNSLMINTHGLPGAILFLQLNDILRKYPHGEENPYRQFCVDWACTAIMMHDMCKHYWGKNKIKPANPHLRLSLEVDPISTILTLCDVIQEFDRPCAMFSKNEEADEVNLKYDTTCNETELIVDESGTMEIVYKFHYDGDRLNKMRFLKTEEHNYFDPMHGFIDISSLGLKQVKLRAEKLEERQQ